MIASLWKEPNLSAVGCGFAIAHQKMGIFDLKCSVLRAYEELTLIGGALGSFMLLWMARALQL